MDDDDFAKLYESNQARESQKDEDDQKYAIGRRIEVKGLSHSMDKKDMKEFLSKYGEIMRLETSKNRRGWCAADFADRKDASRAIIALDGNKLNGRQLKVEPMRLFSSRRGSHSQILDDEDEDNDQRIVQFSGRGSRSERQRDKVLDRRWRSEKTLCEFCGCQHFAQGCFLINKDFHERNAAGKVVDFFDELNQPCSQQRDESFSIEKDEEPKPIQANESTKISVPPLGRGRGLCLPSWWAQTELRPDMDKESYMRKHNEQSLPKSVPEKEVVLSQVEEEREEPVVKSRFSRLRHERRIKVNEEANHAVEQWRELALNYVVWPTSDSGIFLKFDFDTSNLFYCRALPGGRILQVDCTPLNGQGQARNITRQIEHLRLDVATDSNAATLEVLGLAAQRASYTFLNKEYTDLAELCKVLLQQPSDVTLPNNIAACWSPSHCAYYFHDSETNLVSWVLPQNTNKEDQESFKKKKKKFIST